MGEATVRSNSAKQQCEATVRFRAAGAGKHGVKQAAEELVELPGSPETKRARAWRPTLLLGPWRLGQGGGCCVYGRECDAKGGMGVRAWAKRRVLRDGGAERGMVREGEGRGPRPPGTGGEGAEGVEGVERGAVRV